MLLLLLYLEVYLLLLSLLLSRLRLEYLFKGVSELSLQLPYLVVVELFSLSLLKVSLQLPLTEPFSNLEEPLELLLSNLLLEFAWSPYLVVEDPFSYREPDSNLPVPEFEESNLDILSVPPSELAVLTGLLLYFGSEELESLLVRLVLQLGVAAAALAASLLAV